MKKETLAGKIWGLIYPMLIYLCTTIIVTMVIQIGSLVYWKVTGQMKDTNEINALLQSKAMLFTFLSALCTAPILALFRKRDINKEKAWNIYKKYEMVNPVKYLLIIPFGVFTMIWANMFVSILTMFMPKFMLDSYMGTQQAIFGSSIAIQFLAGGIMGPIVEELLFRGLIYNRAKRMTGVVPAAIISAVLFGIFHGNWVQAPYAMIVGIMAVFVYEKYKSITAPILFHMSANIMATGMSYLANGLAERQTETADISVAGQLISACSSMFINLALAVGVGIIINKVVKAKEVK